MALILARSPYFIEKGNGTDASLVVAIGLIDSSNNYTLLKSYNLQFKNETHLDVAPIIRDYLVDYEILDVNITLNKTIEVLGVDTPTTLTSNFIAVDGYSYYEEGYNKEYSSILQDDKAYYAGSNDVIYRYRDEPVTIPFLLTDILVDQPLNTVPTSTINYYKDNALVSTSSLNFTDIASRVQYIEEDSIDSFEERVLEDGGTIEVAHLSRVYDYLYDNNTPDRVEVIPKGDASKSFELTIVPVDECKYAPNRLVFVNKLGVEEDLWFFKKSVNNINTTRESYRANTLPNYLTGDLSQHSYASYNVNGKKTMTMNTGYIPESFNENLRQLMLSEKVWLYVDGAKLPITIKDSEMQFKTVLNEKLINYEIEVEFAYDIINNIG